MLVRRFFLSRSAVGSPHLRCCSTSLQTSPISPDIVELEPAKKIQIAVIGSGPSGCYVADYLTKKNSNIHVDIYEKLPVPFGLLRYGVAPDHPEVKNLEAKFKDMFRSQRVTWIGNIEAGRSIPIKLLLHAYSAVVISTGANMDKELGIPGEHLGNVFGAREFVNYYNTYPSPHATPKHSLFQMVEGETGPIHSAVVIGNGNVGLDVTRVLASSYKYWCPTDMNCAAIKHLMDNRIRNVHVVGRRGVEHSAFTIAEFRELTKFESQNSIEVGVEQFDLHHILSLATNQSRAKRRLFELVHKFTPQGKLAEAATSRGSSEHHHNISKLDRGPCHIHFQYNRRPVEFLPHPKRREMVGAVRFEVANDSSNTPPTYVLQPCEVVLKSIGYSSQPVRGVPFNLEKKIVDNVEGRVVGEGRLYCSGWCKRGATGVIVHTMMDAHATGQAILDDIENRVVRQTGEQLGKYSLLDYFVEKGLHPISTNALARIWKVEEERGIDLGKRYEKIPSADDMLDIAMSGKIGKLAQNRVRGTANARPDALMYLNELLDDTTDMKDFAKEFWKDIPALIGKDASRRGVNIKELH